MLSGYSSGWPIDFLYEYDAIVDAALAAQTIEALGDDRPAAAADPTERLRAALDRVADL